MANIMALVSKSGFRAIEKEHGTLSLGVVSPITAFHSKQKTLNKLATGGTLFLVTVRDGALWLLAALENPSHDGKSWTAPPNVVPVRDASKLVAQLEFANGKGITAPPEKLAMSLQTPRVLSDPDVLLFRGLGQPTEGSAYRAAIAAQGAGATSKASAGKVPARPRGKAPETPVGWQQAVASIETWSGLDDPARLQAVTEAAADLGDDFTPVEHLYGVGRLGALVHRSGTELLLVPGGHMQMGYTADDIYAVMGVFEDEEVEEYDGDDWASYFCVSRPPRVVAVAPFLCARAPMDLPGDDPLAVLAGDGFRLPSEAEYEWICREGGAVQFTALPTDKHPLGPTISPPVNDEENGWGVRGLLNEGNLAADQWHVDYTGAPEDASAWDAPHEGPWVVRSGHTWWQGPAEAMGLHAAARGYDENMKGLLRPARSLGVAPQGSAPGWDEAVELVQKDMTARKTAARGRASIALRACRLKPGPDATILTGAILDGFEDLPKARQPELLALAAADPEALLPRADRVLSLMAHKKPAVRAQAGRLVAAIHSPKALERCRAELSKERRHAVRAGLVLAIDRIAQGLSVPAPELQELLADKSAHVAAAATVALLQRGERGEELFLAAARAAGVPPLPEGECPWFQGNLGARAYGFLEEAGDEAIGVAARSLIDALADNDELAGPILNLLFEQSEDPVFLLPEELTDLQRAAVEALAELTIPGRRGRDFWDYRLPEPAEMRMWLGLEPPNLVFREITVPWQGGERTWPMWQWLQALRKQAADEGWDGPAYTEAVTRGLEALTPIERLDLYFRKQSMRVQFPHNIEDGERGMFPHGEFDELVAAAAADDLEGTLAYAQAACEREPWSHQWAAALLLEHAPADQRLPDPVYWAVRFGDDENLRLDLWERIPKDFRQLKVGAFIHSSLSGGCVEWSVLSQLRAIAEFYELTEPIAMGILALGSLQLKWSRQTKAPEMVKRVRRKEIKAVLAAWEKSGADKGGKATRPWVKKAIEALEEAGQVYPAT